jgi:hypothetical protein
VAAVLLAAFARPPDAPGRVKLPPPELPADARTLTVNTIPSRPVPASTPVSTFVSRVRPGLAALLGGLVLAAGGLVAGPAGADEAPAAVADQALPLVKVWKTPTCGCCGKWVDHVKAAGFPVEVTNMEDVSPIKAQHGIPPRLSSCHTAVVAGYVVEGHVPVEDVKRLLAERPRIQGIAVPNMPMGSPGMEGPVTQPFDTLALGKDGKTSVFASHGR